MKTILITGSTDGIGKLVAMKLAKEGHIIYVHGRNQEKLLSTISEIKQESNNDNVKGIVADFSNLDSVKEMAEKLKKDTSKLDVLINNAGVFKTSIADNKNSLDMRMVVNYLAPYVLTKELITLLENSSNSRIINLSSAAQSKVSYQVLLGKKKISQGESYAQSKLALTMWSMYLAKENSKITIIPVNPGSLLNTKMANEAYGQSWSSAEKGEKILYELATLEDHKNHSGEYFNNDSGHYDEAHSDAYDKNKIKRLIEVTDELISNLISINTLEEV